MKMYSKTDLEYYYPNKEHKLNYAVIMVNTRSRSPILKSIFSSWEDAEKFIKNVYGIKPSKMKSMYSSTILNYDPPDKKIEEVMVKAPVWSVDSKLSPFEMYYIEIWDSDAGVKIPFDNKHIFVDKEHEDE